jgi:hypothetical protein
VGVSSTLLLKSTVKRCLTGSCLSADYLPQKPGDMLFPAEGSGQHI